MSQYVCVGHGVCMDFEQNAGNETAALIGWWILRNYRLKHGSQVDLQNCFMISSTVSSFILKVIQESNFMLVDLLVREQHGQLEKWH